MQIQNSNAIAQQSKEPDIFDQHGMQGPILMLAPMEGITNQIYRNIVLDCGAPHLVATEFIRISHANQNFHPFHRHKNAALQIQLMACDAQLVEDTLKRLYDRELIFSSDWLDLNVGCPSRRVNSHGAGAALLKTPEKIVALTSAMRAVHRGPLSLKTRIGLQSVAEYPRILSVLKDAPLDFVTFHARTKAACYEGQARWDYLRRAVDTLPYPVIGNGDINTSQTAQHVLKTTGVRGIMCGRGAIQNPYLFKDILSPESPDADKRRSDLLLVLQRLGGELKEQKFKLGRFKEYLSWFDRNPFIPENFFSGLKRINCWEEMMAALPKAIQI